MKALISTVEIRESGYRVAEVKPDDGIFPTYEDFFWVDCPNDLKADEKWYDPSDKQFKNFLPAPVFD
jgi:hypothetical protein